MSVSISGQLPTEPQQVRYGWNRQIGDYMEWIWTGPGGCTPPSLLDSNFALRRVSDDTTYENIGNGMWRLSMKFAGRTVNGEHEQSVDEVRMEMHESARDLALHPTYIVIDRIEIGKIKKGAEKEMPVFPDGVLITELKLKFWRLWVMGEHHFSVEDPVLIKTRIASSQFKFDAAWSNVGKIVSAENIIADAEIDGLLMFNLPAAPNTAPTSFMWGWLKKSPAYEPASNNRYVLIQRYVWGLWDLWIYDAAT